jgi:hypothetical protein
MAWVASSEDLARFKMALKQLVSKVPAKEMGSRFEDLFTAGKKARTHHFFVLASSYGKC